MSNAALRASSLRKYVSAVDADYFVAIWRGVLPVVFVEKGIALCILAYCPSGRGSFIDSLKVMSARTRSTAISFIKPRFFIPNVLLLVEVPKNLGPTE